MLDSDDKLIRSDRIGLYTRSGWEGKMPWLTPEYGDVWLTDTARVGFVKTKWWGTDWDTTLGEITDVSEVSRRTALRCYQGAFPDRLIAFTANDTRYIAFFTGIIKFQSTTEKVIAHIPGVHHAGALAVGLKSGWDNRGTADRGRAAREAWMDVLTRRVDLPQIPA